MKTKRQALRHGLEVYRKDEFRKILDIIKVLEFSWDEVYDIISNVEDV